MLTATDQAELRRLGKAARRALPPQLRARHSTALCHALSHDPRLAAARVILTYSAAPSEADPAALCHALQAAGKQIAYPRCISAGVMEARLPEGESPFTPDFCGIAAPDPAHSRLLSPEAIDLVLVPLTAFDADCHRIGMGGGFYDRFLPQCKNAAFYGLAFSVQQAEAILPAEWDVSLHAVFTENGIFYLS